MAQQLLLGDIASPPREDSVAKFFHEALSSSALSCALVSKPRMDVTQYWEKRRIQNGLRRLLEALQERFGLDCDAQASELAPAFEALCAVVGRSGQSGELPPGDDESVEDPCLDEQQLCAALEALNAWPPELSSSDRTEIFSALLVPSVVVAQAMLQGQLPTRTSINSRTFCDGFDRVPFNLPDFPVPAYLLHPSVLQSSPETFTAEQTEAVAKAVATTFCMDMTGLEKVKDFFLCGLITLEEIQRALPKLVPQALVEDAVTRIIRRGAPHFTTEDWQGLVVALRVGEATLAAGVGPAAPAVAAEAVPEDSAATAVLPPAGGGEVAALPSTAQALTPRGPAMPPPLWATVGAGASGGSEAVAGITSQNCEQAEAEELNRELPAPRTPERRPLTAVEAGFIVSLASPLAQHRECPSGEELGTPAWGSGVSPGVLALQGGAATGEVGIGTSPGRFLDHDGSPSALAELPRFRGRFEPVTEPLPCRELLSEDPVRFLHGDPTPVSVSPAAAACADLKRVVDWSTAIPGAAASNAGCTWGGHQADKGAGARLTWGTSSFKRELANKAAALAAGGQGENGANGQVDHLAWINLDLHNECGGPYLARAFVLCCQLHERRRLREGG